MEKKSLKWYSALGMGLLYMAMVFAACFFGFIGPACRTFFPVVAALLGAGAYFWLAARWQKFGVGTFAAVLVCLFCLATGEAAGFLSKAVIVAGGVLADIVRLLVGNTSKKGLYTAYPLLASGNIGWIVNLWIRPQWYIDGAVEEMGQVYADGIARLQNPWVFSLCVVFTAAIAVLSIWLCTKVDKKSAGLLKENTVIRNSNTIKVLLLAIVYLAIFLLGASSGMIHPACYAYVGAILPLLFALVYLYTATVIRGFGAATVLNGFLLVVGLLTGEADTTFIIGIIALTALAELIRYFFKYDTLKGIRWSFVPFALSFFPYTLHWWIDTEGSLAAAVAEMRPGYDELMRPVIDNVPMLIVAIVLTIPVAILAMRLAERALKKQTSLLK